MTTIRQLIQTSPTKANDLFAKLADTSETAVKTRERLFSDLKAELGLQAKLEEQHLFPVLRKHKETKELVAKAQDDNRQTGKLLAELERTPKDGEAFAAKVAELRKAFQQHVRDEKKELLPAVVKALSDEEASAVVEKIEDEKAEVEAARRAEAEERRAEAKRERERAEAAEAKQVEAKQAEAEREREETEAERQAVAKLLEREKAEAARRAEAKQAETKREREKLEAERQMVAKREREEAEAAQQAAEASEDTAKAGAQVARQGATVARVATAKLPRVATKAGADAAGEMGRAARTAAPSDEEQAAVPEMAQSAAAIGSSVVALLGEQTRHAMQTATALGRARTPAEVVKAQSDFIGASVQRAGRLNERYLALLRSGMASMPFFPTTRR